MEFDRIDDKHSKLIHLNYINISTFNLFYTHEAIFQEIRK